MKEYLKFLETKIRVSEKHGFKIDPDTLHPSNKPHQSAIIAWALELGAAGVFADCGLGKTAMGIETCAEVQARFGGKALIATELGATDTFVHADPEIGEGARLGVQLEYVTCDADALASPCDIVVTNYERIRNGGFDFSKYTCVWLDEGNYLKDLSSDTTNALAQQLAKVKYKFVATATPSPNELLEIINYAHVLGIADRGQILTRFFQRNSTKAGELTLHPQHERDFWMWVSSWAIFIERPSDLGFSDEGYALPDLQVNWIEVPFDGIEAKADRDGQHRIFADSIDGLPEAARIKRASMEARIRAAVKIIEQDPAAHFLLWHHLEDERKALQSAFAGHPSYGEIFGSQDWTVRESRIVDFSLGKLQLLATKPELSGVGCNFQKHCRRAIFLGINHSFDKLYQALKRIHRFGQRHGCTVDILYVPQERHIVDSLKAKWKLHKEQREKMREIVLKYGLSQSQYIEECRRSFIQAPKKWQGENFVLVNNDCVFEVANLPENSMDMILTSIPFGNHYEYTDKYNDFGHNLSNNEFHQQMRFLVTDLLRVLKPGRIAAIHTKNRIHYGSVTGNGFSVLHRFSHKTCDVFEECGFFTLGNHFVPTDVVAENNQTYRLTYGEMKKDATKMGAGIPEEIWIFRKAPTSSANAYADQPVARGMACCSFCGYTDKPSQFEVPGGFLYLCPGCKQYLDGHELKMDREEYSLSNWQLDADAFWKSSGNRFITPEEMIEMGLDRILAWWKNFNSTTIYDYDRHAALLDALDSVGKLSRTFTTLPLQSNTPHIWSGTNRMHGLNSEQAKRGRRNHICPMPFDQVDRLLKLYSRPGDMILDPFGGLGTTGVRAIKHGRRAVLVELNETYAGCAATYLKEEEMKRSIPTLFDMIRDFNTETV